MLSLHWERAQASNEEYEEIAFLPFIRQKTTLHRKFDELEGRSDHCSEE